MFDKNFEFRKEYSRIIIFSLIVIIIIILPGLSPFNVQKESSELVLKKINMENQFPFDLNNPDTVYHLPNNLEEISGITFFKKNKIACIQDERASIYIFDIKKDKVTSIFEFGKNNDYEDITMVGNNIYVLRSDGTLFKIKNMDSKRKIKTIKIETLLNKKNDTEGLVYDKNANSLLIACKGSPSINENELYEGFKAIYRFDLETNTLIEKPEYLIDLSKFDDINNKGSIEKLFIEAAKKLNLTNSDNIFHPSGLAIDPFDTEKIYIISSIGKLLMTINRQGTILDIIELDKRIFNKPEGICFSEDGDMFISNEGKNGNGNIIKINH